MTLNVYVFASEPGQYGFDVLNILAFWYIQYYQKNNVPPQLPKSVADIIAIIVAEIGFGFEKFFEYKFIIIN